MPKYAIVTTADPRFLPGVNALINAINYYGIDCDFHLLYWDDGEGTIESYLDRVEDSHAIRISPKRFDLRDWPRHFTDKQKPAFYLKFSRHIYPYEQLMDYDAVVIMDADMAIVNDITPFFEITKATGKILIPSNTHTHSQEYDNYSTAGLNHSYTPPLYSMPLFFVPKLHSNMLKEIPPEGWKLQRGEMVAVNSIIDKYFKNDVIVQPNCLWVQTRWKELPITELWSNHKRFLTIADDRLYTIHGRWWQQETLDKYYPSRPGQLQTTVTSLHETFRVLNDYKVKLDWQWGRLIR